MTNAELQIKVKERLNKLASLDYDNFECWQIVEAFNKAQLEWIRRQVIGANQLQSGEGSTNVNYDDLQKLINSDLLALLAKETDTPQRFGVLSVDKEGNLLEIIENPMNYSTNLVNIGAYCTKEGICLSTVLIGQTGSIYYRSANRIIIFTCKTLYL
jgi:hypothetical protein